jgi:hypothetical protein
METLCKEVWKRSRWSSVITSNNKKVNSVVRAVHWGKKIGVSRFHPLYYVLYFPAYKTHFFL